MKFRHVQVKNGVALIPLWIADPIAFLRALDRLLDDYITQRGSIPRWDQPLPFSIEMDSAAIDGQLRLVEYPSFDKETPNQHGKLIVTAESPLGGPCVVNIPLNPFLKQAAPVNDFYCLYQHVINTETPLAYIGITRQRWFDRLTQHARDAAKGSHYLFHGAIRQHPLVQKGHAVFLVELTQQQAMDFEEEFVREFTLYPLGLNMIPGGYAGFKYLGSLGISVKTPLDRDQAIIHLSTKEMISGNANPLCAARWAADQDYVNRVICGHSGRLTVAQIRAIRRLSQFGISGIDISRIIGSSVKKVISVTNAKRYRRVQ